jgi:GrpB-like predicted nucleotidyltransferase (UPF0157 family)
MKQVIVETYNPEWKSWFSELYDVYQKLLHDLDIKIIHVGSTSVPNLISKPIIDIDIIVYDQETLEEVIKRLASIGYIHRGNLGIEGREAFKRETKEVPLGRDINHHLYVCMNGVDSLVNHLKLKEYLLSHPEAVVKYGELKIELSKKYPYDIDSYVEGKTELITMYLKEAGMSFDSLEDIIEANKKEKSKK